MLENVEVALQNQIHFSVWAVLSHQLKVVLKNDIMYTKYQSLSEPLHLTQVGSQLTD
jgi:hypothetical protein